ncbi:MAG: hypothetical protein KDI32_08895 [Pseudomonadales bacterium]|nr:hypothetical protein [Pseudomonadales bacterium]
MTSLPSVLGREEVLKLIPHQGDMCLLDSVAAWHDDWIEACTLTHRSTPHPLASNGRIRAVNLCEYGAQAMAVHGGLLCRKSGVPVRPGLLVSLRAVSLYCDFIDTFTGELKVRADRLLVQRDSWQYEFRVMHDGVPLASGRAAVVARADG